jgi:hypothetical protein
MKKLIRIFSYFLMILGAVIILGGLGTGIAMLVARGAREVGRALPMMRMLGPGSAVMTALRVMLQGLLVSGFGMVIYLLGEFTNTRPTELMQKSPGKNSK